MTFKDVMTQLEAAGNAQRRKHNIKNGSGEKTFGVLHGELRKLAKTIGRDHPLALELWATDNVDAQWLACLIMEPKSLSKADLQQMAAGLSYPLLIDRFTDDVVDGHPAAAELEREWIDSGNDNLGRAGWNLTTNRVQTAKLPPAELDQLIAVVQSELPSAAPATQWAMNHAFCEIGIRYPDYTDRCLALGEQMGVYRDMKVSKGCTSAFAPAWINAIVGKRKPMGKA